MNFGWSRRNLARTFAALLIFAVVGLPGSWVAAADPFYENLLAKGTDQYNRRDFVAAAHTLRLACFGLLEEPERLAEGLVRLGLAQAAAGQNDLFAETFRRVAEVEDRFGAYGKAPIPDPVRAEFERHARVLLPASTLRATPGFTHLTGPPPVATAVPRSAQERRGNSSRPEAGPSPEDAAQLQQTLALLAEGRVVEAFDRSRALADARPAWKEAQLAAAEAAYRLARWSEAVAYFARAGDPGEGQPLLLFYWAVSLFEAGEKAHAAEVLRRALPRIKHTEYVDAYKAKILGSS
ncbi:MAG: hypothetical protein HRF46_16385 [Acidobacteriota bacterium]